MDYDNEKRYEFFNSCVPNFYYLESRGWFVRNQLLQQKLFNLCKLGFGHKVFVTAGDFESHIDYLLDHALQHPIH
jgi:hypothetical protein